MTGLTPKQKQVLDYLEKFIGEHGYSPTLEQIRRRFRLRSLSTIHEHLNALRDKGRINRRHNTPHGISLAKKTPDIPGRLVPVTGEIEPDGALRDDAIGSATIEVPATLAPSDESFALRIAGSPLPGSGLQDGDFIVARETGDANGHELVIAEVDGRTRLTATGTTTGTAQDGQPGKPTAVRAVVTGMLRTFGPTQA